MHVCVSVCVCKAFMILNFNPFPRDHIVWIIKVFITH